MLKAALYGDGNEYDPDYVRGIWDIDEIPKGKRTSLKRFYDGLLSKTELSEFPKGKDVKYFIDGDTVLSCCIYSLYENVIEVLEKYSGIDVMGEFYTTFLRFTKGNAKEKGIVLTPKHITDLFCDIAEYYSDKKLDETTKIIDICCGSGAFLISALDRIKRNIYSETISESEKSLRYATAQRNSLIEDKISKLTKQSKDLKKKDAVYNKSEIANIEKEITKFSKQIEDLNEYLVKNGLEEVIIQKGQDELDFIASMLHYLKVGGIGIAIIPMSCAGNSGAKLRAKLLQHHTLLACMSMPSQVFFDSHVGANTCIIVLKAHIPHDSKKATFLGRWKDDGFIVIPHNGRKDSGKWDSIRREWIEQLDGTAPSNDVVFVRRKIRPTDEALAEAYTKTDYSQLKNSDFEKTLKKFSLYKFMDEHGLLED